MFRKIVSNISDRSQLGYACICLSSAYQTKIREEFTKCGEHEGFKKVEFIDETTAIYFDAMVQSQYEPHVGDVIWIFCGSCYVWSMQSPAKFIKAVEFNCAKTKRENFKKIQMDSNLRDEPALIVYYRYNRPSYELINRMFPQCTVASFVYNKVPEACITKTQLMADDVSLFPIDAETAYPEPDGIHHADFSLLNFLYKRIRRFSSVSFMYNIIKANQSKN